MVLLYVIINKVKNTVLYNIHTNQLMLVFKTKKEIKHPNNYE